MNIFKRHNKGFTPPTTKPVIRAPAQTHAVRPPARPKPTYKVETGTMNTTMTFIKKHDKTLTAIPPRPTIYYTWQVKRKMDILVETCQQEVGWMCLVDATDDGDFIITDIYVPEQEVHATETDISADALCKLAMELMNKDIDTSKMYGWFHSHVNMGVTPSTQDEEQVAEFLDTCPVFIRGIVNKRGEYKVDAYFRDAGIAHTNLTAKVLLPALSDEEEKQFKATINANVTEVRFHNYRHWANRFEDDDDYYGVYNGSYSQHSRSTHGGLTQPPTQNLLTDHSPLFDDDNFIYCMGDDDLEDKGYGVDWDIADPLGIRPTGWFRDPNYLSKGFPDDAFLYIHAEQGVRHAEQIILFAEALGVTQNDEAIEKRLNETTQQRG